VARNHSVISAFPLSHLPTAFCRILGIEMNKTKVKTAALPRGWALPFILAALAFALALLAAPHAGRAQGIVRGAQEGAYEGNRVSAAPWARSRACLACPSRTGGTTAGVSATVMGASTATGTDDVTRS
jgi:hypothetical protein